MWIQAVNLTPTAPDRTHGTDDGEEEEEVSFLSQGLSGVTRALSGFALGVTDALRKAGPQRITVEFGCQIAVEEGGLVALITKAGMDANLTITLEWDRTAVANAAGGEPALDAGAE